MTITISGKDYSISTRCDTAEDVARLFEYMRLIAPIPA